MIYVKVAFLVAQMWFVLLVKIQGKQLQEQNNTAQ